jgi:thiol:disulfide interchange protein
LFGRLYKMRRIGPIIAVFLLGLLMAPGTIGADDRQAAGGLLPIPGETGRDAVRVKTAWSVDSVRPGDRFTLAVVLDIKKGVHIIADADQLLPSIGFRPYPTRVAVTEASDELTIEAIRYPQAHAASVDFISGDLMSFEGLAIVYLPMKLDHGIKASRLHIKVKIAYQACDVTLCAFPATVVLEASLPVAEPNRPPLKVNRALFAGYSQASTTASSGGVGFDLFGLNFSIDTTNLWGFILLLLTASIGGALLNFTPCVLPLVPIKIISLSNAAADQKRCLALGLTMFSGVLVFWLGIGTAIALITGFTATHQLFQYPVFTIAVGAVIAVMAFGMCGLFSVRLPNFIYRINPTQDTLQGSFVLGILTAILATPCTAPFMGAAAAWAATQPPATTLATFAAIGIGMALPYLVLSARPRLVQKMPHTGPASVLIKEVMGLFMMAAAAYFIGTGLSGMLMEPPNPPAKLYWFSVMGFTAAGGLWLAYRTIRITSRKTLRVIFAGLGILLFVGSAYGVLRLTDKGPIDWVYYTPERFAAATENRKIIVMVFTAEWCLNCKALEEGVLKSEKITRLLAEADIVPMKVDITGNNPWGKKKLKETGNLTIPLLVIYSPKGREVFRSDFYTIDQVVEGIETARRLKRG